MHSVTVCIENVELLQKEGNYLKNKETKRYETNLQKKISSHSGRLGTSGLIYLTTTIFNKIAIQGPDVKWTSTPLSYRESKIFSSMCHPPPEICVNLVFKHIHTASSNTICR